MFKFIFQSLWTNSLNMFMSIHIQISSQLIISWLWDTHLFKYMYFQQEDVELIYIVIT